MNEIARRIADHGHAVNKATLLGNLARYVKDRKVFAKGEKRGHYGLLNWDMEASRDFSWN